MKITIRGEEHEIVDIVYHKQSKEYHEAIKNGDSFAALCLHLPPTHIPFDVIQRKISRLERSAERKVERERINNMSEKHLEFEIELMFK